MLSPTYEITTALSHTDELISPPYDIAIVTISYGRVTMSSVWDSMMSKKNMGWPFYAAVQNNEHIPVGQIAWLNLYAALTFWPNLFNNMSADVLSPCVARTLGDIDYWLLNTEWMKYSFGVTINIYIYIYTLRKSTSDYVIQFSSYGHSDHCRLIYMIWQSNQNAILVM